VDKSSAVLFFVWFIFPRYCT